MYVCLRIYFMHIYAYVCLYVSEINDSDDTRDEREEIKSYFIINIRY